MSVEVVTGQEDTKRELLAALNRSFPRWGGEEMFAWAFQRRGAGLTPDLLVERADGIATGGCAVVYRRVRQSDGRPSLSAVISGAWTDPVARRTGVFTRLIEGARSVASERGAAALIAFTHADNASTRRLAAASAELSPAWYCTLRRDAPAGELTQELPDYARFATRVGPTFLYDREEWTGQFVDRVRPVVCVSLERGVVLLQIEEDGVRLLASTPDDAFSWNVGELVKHGPWSRISCYTTIPERCALLEEFGFSASPGFVSIIPPSRMDWNLEDGDRI